eukprot:4051665-Prymnesium_polylepis.2
MYDKRNSTTDVYAFDYCTRRLTESSTDHVFHATRRRRPGAHAPQTRTRHHSTVHIASRNRQELSDRMDHGRLSRPGRWLLRFCLARRYHKQTEFRSTTEVGSNKYSESRALTLSVGEWGQPAGGSQRAEPYFPRLLTRPRFRASQTWTKSAKVEEQAARFGAKGTVVDGHGATRLTPPLRCTCSKLQTCNLPSIHRGTSHPHLKPTSS